MYHFTADHRPEPLRLSFRALIPGHIRQYLKDFQLEAIRFMHSFFTKDEFCVYNDESGLGKQAAVVVLLDAACSNRKCLIVVQNDDRYVNGWEFHFSVLTNINVAVIKDENDTTDSPHNIYIAKWSTLRTINDLSKLKFDFIILDNRGQMLNNSFCTSMLLKHYERRINILISSVDITSDLKLLHNVLRLGSRLDPQYSSFKVFEEKFKLPDAKELAYKRVDLEEYFCKRERLADYCKHFRLRRYCHQFETQLPLVKEDRYKINLDMWRDKQNATNSESSSVEYVNKRNREDEQMKDTQELFEEYCRQRRKQHLQFQQEEEQRLKQREQDILKSLVTEKEIVYSVDDEVALINDTPSVTMEKQNVVRDNSDELVLMSPLLVESESDIDDIPEICDDLVAGIEIVDLSSEEKDHNKQNVEENIDENSKQTKEDAQCSVSNQKLYKRKPPKKRSELEKLEEDIVDSLKITTSSKRLSRHVKDDDRRGIQSRKRLKGSSNEAYPNNIKSSNLTSKRENKNIKSSELKISLVKSAKKNSENLQKVKKSMKENCRSPKISKTLDETNCRNISSSVPANDIFDNNCKEKVINNKNETISTTTLSVSSKTRSIKNPENISNKTSTIKQEVLEGNQQIKKICHKHSEDKFNNEKIRLKRELEILPMGIHHKQTRSMQRLTRSAGGSKYITKNLSLQIDKISKRKKKSPTKAAPKNSGPIKKEVVKNNNNNNNSNNAQNNTNKTQKTIENNSNNTVRNTQTSVISHRSSQDYESLQCAQRLSDGVVFDNGLEKTTEFLVPPTPNVIAKNSLIPSSLTLSSGLLTESDIMFITPSNPNPNRKRDQVILLSSSDNDNSTSQSSSTNVSLTSRRTRALKPKKNLQMIAGETSKMPSFSELLAQQKARSSAKSPDLFSNCSDLIQLPCTQQNLNSVEPNTPFEGFKIFGSEVKQLQQHYASNINNVNNPNANSKTSYREQRSCLDILEKMFEPANKKSKQLTNEKSCTPTKKSSRVVSVANKQNTNTQILPSHPIEAITEARQQQGKYKAKRSATALSSRLQDDDIFEITNNGTFGSVMRLHSNGEISPVQNTQKINTKQHNKITNYLIGNVVQNVSQEDITANSGNSTGNFNLEAGTPSKKHQEVPTNQNNVKKSPKSKCTTTQATKLTKWFIKPSEMCNQDNSYKAKSSNSKKTPYKQLQTNREVDLTTTTSPPVAAGKRILKRRRLDLSFNK